MKCKITNCPNEVEKSLHAYLCPRCENDEYEYRGILADVFDKYEKR